MEYEEINLLKRSEKSIVHLVREKYSGKVFVQKVLEGKKEIYLTLKNYEHPYLPKLYEVSLSDDTTTVIEEYIEGESLGSAELSEKQLLCAARELCSVLEFLHGKEIIHRDVKPSNIILASDGHIRLIDFDAARQPKDDLEQDTRLLGTRGYAPPEQYGFAQTDARTDIYALGITLKQLLGDKAQKISYRHIIQKCTKWNPEKRYQSVGKVKRAFCYGKYGIWFGGGSSASDFPFGGVLDYINLENRVCHPITVACLWWMCLLTLIGMMKQALPYGAMCRNQVSQARLATTTDSTDKMRKRLLNPAKTSGFLKAA